MAGDLHTHTTFSDGSLSSQYLVQIAQQQNLTHLAISDHDSEQSVKFAQQQTHYNISLIPATELTAYDFDRKQRVHILCYYPDLSPAFLDFCRTMRHRRNQACKKSMEKLLTLFPDFNQQLALDLCKDSGILYKTHLIRVLYEMGYTDGIYKELYQQLFGSKTGIALYNPPYESVETVLDIIHQSKGVAVLAHPSVYHSMELAVELAKNKKIDGVEIYHPKNTPADIQQLEQLAIQYQLCITGGSDFHGMHSSRPTYIGKCTTTTEQIDYLQQIAQTKKGV